MSVQPSVTRVNLGVVASGILILVLFACLLSGSVRKCFVPLGKTATGYFSQIDSTRVAVFVDGRCFCSRDLRRIQCEPGLNLSAKPKTGGW